MRLVRSNNLMLIFRAIALVALILLSACHRSTYVPEKEDPKLPCKVLGACDKTIILYMKRFNKRGIQVITIGQEYMVSIPASYLFYDQSPRLRWSAYGLLNEVSTFIKQFRKIEIDITSFSSKYKSNQRERALTIARSRAVGSYLWSQGVDSRFIFTQGLGSEKPIIGYSQGGDKSPNARVEITFRRAVA